MMLKNRTRPLRLNLFPLLLFAAALLAGTALAEHAGSFAGEWVRDNPENEWHRVKIESGDGGKLIWKNEAGKSWTLLTAEEGRVVRTTNDCPYGEQNLRILIDKTGKPIALGFNNETYRRVWHYGHEDGWPYMGDPKIQSPVEVPQEGGARKLPGAYMAMPAINVENNGHTFQLNYGPKGGGTLESDSRRFTLEQFHFHSPSEHTQPGYAGWTDEDGTQHPGHYAMEVHFVHTDHSFAEDKKAAPQRRNLAVVGVFIKEGAENAELAKLWAECPEKEGKDTDLGFAGFDASKLMPAGGSFQTYVGSLTTPPLSSGVSWIVMDEPIEASKEQIAKLRDAMKRDTNRSIQGSLRARTGRE